MVLLLVGCKGSAVVVVALTATVTVTVLVLVLLVVDFEFEIGSSTLFQHPASRNDPNLDCFHILTSKCASGHNVRFLSLSFSKGALNLL